MQCCVIPLTNKCVRASNADSFLHLLAMAQKSSFDLPKTECTILVKFCLANQSDEQCRSKCVRNRTQFSLSEFFNTAQREVNSWKFANSFCQTCMGWFKATRIDETFVKTTIPPIYNTTGSLQTGDNQPYANQTTVQNTLFSTATIDECNIRSYPPTLSRVNQACQSVCFQKRTIWLRLAVPQRNFGSLRHVWGQLTWSSEHATQPDKVICFCFKHVMILMHTNQVRTFQETKHPEAK